MANQGAGVVGAMGCLLVGLVLGSIQAAHAAPGGRDFERTFPVSGAVALEAVTNAGRVDVRVGGGSIVVRGTIRRSVGWSGSKITDEQIATVRAAPPVRADGSTVRIERLADDALWRGIAIDFEIVVPPSTKVLVGTASGAVSVEGSRGDVRVETGSGAIRADAAGGRLDLRSGSGSIHVVGSMESLAMTSQSSSLEADVAFVGAVEASSGSGSVRIAGIRGTARVESGSGRIALDGKPLGDWSVRSRSGSIALRIPADSRFHLSAASHSGQIKTEFAVGDSTGSSKRSVEGPVNGGGPKLDVATRSSQITLGS